MTDTLLSITDLEVVFKTQQETLRVLCGVTFDIYEGEIFGLVGEFGLW